MMMKKVFVMMSMISLLSFGMTGCSSDDDSLHFFQDIYVPYIPISYNEAPDWLKPIMEKSGEGGVNTTIIRGRWNGQYVYNVHNDLMSILSGVFLDQDGNRMDVVDFESLIYEAEDWTCIIKYTYY
jgi:hypothetical protein